MSVWGNYSAGPAPPPGTPDLRIRWSPEGVWRVYAEQTEVYSTAEGYYPAHRWCQNYYRLTSTMMLPVYVDYERDVRRQETPEEEEEEQCQQQPTAAPPRPQNKYRKPGA